MKISVGAFFLCNTLPKFNAVSLSFLYSNHSGSSDCRTVMFSIFLDSAKSTVIFFKTSLWTLSMFVRGIKTVLKFFGSSGNGKITVF